MPFYSPLRYPGGKRKLSSFLKKSFEANGLCDGTYIEPYAGGAGAALSLLLDHYARRIVINDIDIRVYAFWWSILEETESLLRLIRETPVDLRQWHIQKHIIRNPEFHSLLELGFATFFMNRTNRSGILDGGVIGGQNQVGNYAIDVRFNRDDLSRRIELIAQHKNRISIFNLDALELLDEITPTIPNKSLFYFDPPYYIKGRDLYTNHYNHNDHLLISEKVRKLDHSWVVTYDNVPAIRDMYAGEKLREFSLTYTAHSERRQGLEILLYRLDEFPRGMNGQIEGVHWY